jgi:hypothetical protein
MERLLGRLRDRVRVKGSYGRSPQPILRRTMRFLKALLCATLLVASPLELRLEAQERSGTLRRPDRVPVMLALVDTLAGEAPFSILRRVDVAPHDVILLGVDADSAVLSAAIRDLLSIRLVQGDTARTSTGVMRVRREYHAAQRNVRTIPWSQRVLNDLHRAEPHAISGVGTVRAVQIWLPSQRRHPAAQVPVQ